MDHFDIVVVAFSVLVFLILLLGCFAVCLKCLAIRMKRRRLAPVEDGVERRESGGSQLDKWPDMTNQAVKERIQREDGRAAEEEQSGSREDGRRAARVQQGQRGQAQPVVQPIAGILVVRPSMPLQQQDSIITVKHNSRRTIEQRSRERASSEGEGQGELDQQMQQQQTDTDRRQHAAERLARAEEFKSSLWLSGQLQEEEGTEEEEGEGESATARERGKRASLHQQEEDLREETLSEQTERQMLGARDRDLPEDGMAEQETKEAIRRAIGPPQPRID